MSKTAIFTSKELQELVNRAYRVAKEHGFHEVRHGLSHYLMLTIGEVGEAVEADRKGHRADLGAFELLSFERPFGFAFREHVKDTLEDELADVCIRLFDLCGVMGTVPVDMSAEMYSDFEKRFYHRSVCSQCYYLTCILTRCDGAAYKEDWLDEDVVSVMDVVGAALTYVFCMSRDLGIDIRRHIELKMRYNSERPMLNGKKY